MGLVLVASQKLAFADACEDEALFSKTGEMFTPQEGQVIPSGQNVVVTGWWDNPDKKLHAQVLHLSGTNVLLSVDMWSSSTNDPTDCTPAGSPCPSIKNRYPFSVVLPISSTLGPGLYRIRVHREGTPCNFAKPISDNADGDPPVSGPFCYTNCRNGGGNYCDCTAGGKDGTCGTGYRNVFVNQQ
jgi:hypothetical protein